MTCRAVLSIGSNQGDSLALLRGVVQRAAEDAILRAVSSVYATSPWGGVRQGDFLNAILVVEHPGSPVDVLEWGFAREREAERVREVRWGPRTLDVDVVSAELDGEPVISDDPALTLPHPRAVERAFVLIPWLEIEPGALLHGTRVSDHLAALEAGSAGSAGGAGDADTDGAAAATAGVRRLDDPLTPTGWVS